MELKDSIHNFVEDFLISVKCPNLKSYLVAFDPESDDKDAIRD